MFKLFCQEEKKMAFCVLLSSSSNYLPEKDLCKLSLNFKCFLLFPIFGIQSKMYLSVKSHNFSCLSFLSGREVVSLTSWKKDCK